MWFLRVALLNSALAAPADHFCGDAWNGGIIGAEQSVPERVHLVVSHCTHSLAWLTEYLNMSAFQTMTIISKCGVVPNPAYGAQTINLPNRGRCDHTYAWWMVHMASSDTRIQDNDIVLFVKDSHHVSIPSSNIALANITFQVANSNGFACAERPQLRLQEQLRGKEFCQKHYLAFKRMTSFAYTAELDTFSSYSYNGGRVKGVVRDHERFKSNYKNLGEWRRAMGMEWTSIVPVCYGGMFAAKVKNIKAQVSISLLLALRSLSRADNLEEGHFMERSWAALLQNPLSAHNITAIQMHTRMVGKSLEWDAGIIYANCATTVGGNNIFRTCTVFWMQDHFLFVTIFLMSVYGVFCSLKRACEDAKVQRALQTHLF